MAKLNGKTIAILATNGFEQSELETPRDRLTEAGAVVDIISPEKTEIRGWDTDDWGQPVGVDKTVSDANPADYDALVLPGGQINPDLLRVNDDALDFIKTFFGTGRPVAAICHAPWLIIETGLAAGRKMTSYKSIATDVKNAGAQWQDDEVVKDGNLITSRNPSDLEAFSNAIIEAVERGEGATQAA